MKRNLFTKIAVIAILAYLAMPAMAQKIIMDTADANGIRSLLAEGGVLFKNKNSIATFNLGCIAVKNVTPIYILYVEIGYDERYIDKGNKLLIKFSDDSILELENDNKIGPGDYTYKIEKYGTNYYVKPYYEMTKEQVQEIIEKEAVKVRIECNTGVIDGEISKNKFSKLMATMYENIKDALSVEKDLYSDF